MSVDDRPAGDDAAVRGVFERHLLPVLDQLHDGVRVGRRTLLGSVASAVCYALLRASDVLPGGAVPAATRSSDALDLADLVDFGPDEHGRLTVARRTCCLAFALPDAEDLLAAVASHRPASAAP